MKIGLNRMRWLAYLLPVLLVLAATCLPRPSFANGDVDCMNSCAGRGSAQADCLQSCNIINLDHRCLNVCIANGTSAYTCRQSCSYIKDTALAPPQAPRTSIHSQFTAGILIDPTVLAPPPPSAAPTTTAKNQLSPTVQPLGPSTNFKCLSQCAQNGLNFGYCRQQCTY